MFGLAQCFHISMNAAVFLLLSTFSASCLLAAAADLRLFSAWSLLNFLGALSWVASALAAFDRESTPWKAPHQAFPAQRLRPCSFLAQFHLLLLGQGGGRFKGGGKCACQNMCCSTG